jgi:hypothetical protein
MGGRQGRPIIIEHGRLILAGPLHCPMLQALQHYRPLPQLRRLVLLQQQLQARPRLQLLPLVSHPLRPQIF